MNVQHTIDDSITFSFLIKEMTVTVVYEYKSYY